MPTVSLIPAVGAGFDLIRRSPGAVMVWGLIAAVLGAAPFLLTIWMFGPQALSTQWGDLQSGSVDPEQFFQSLASKPLQNVLDFIFNVVRTALITPAIYRAVMDPEGERRNFYLRFGMTELYVGVLAVLMGILTFVAVLGGLLAGGVPIGILAAVLGIGHGFNAVTTPLFVLFVVAVCLAVLIAILWIFARLWMAAPMTVAEGRLRLFEGWAFTRGFGRGLVGMGFVLVLLVIILSIAALIVFILLAAIAALVTGVSVLSLGKVAGLGPLIVFAPLAGVLWFAAVSILQAVASAPWARAYQIIAEATGRGEQDKFD